VVFIEMVFIEMSSGDGEENRSGLDTLLILTYICLN